MVKKLIITFALLLVPSLVFAQGAGRTGDPGRSPWVNKLRGTLQGPLQFRSFVNGSESANPRTGDVIYSSTDSALRVYNGAAWTSLAIAGVGDSGWMDSGVFVELATTSDNVTIGGTSDPGVKLEVVGNTQLTGTTAITSVSTTVNAFDVVASSLTSGSALRVYSNSSDSGSRSLILLHNDSPTSNATIPLEIISDGVNHALSVTSAATSHYAIQAIFVNSLTTGGIMDMQSNAATTNTRSLMRIVNDHVNSTGTTTMELRNDSIGYVLDATGKINVTGVAYTALASSTEVVGADFDFSATKQWTVGALATQREVLIRAPTYAFTASSTITTAATFAVDAAPTAGTNATITNPLALWVQAGISAFASNVGIGTTSPTHLLQVSGNESVLDLEGSGANVFMDFSPDGGARAWAMGHDAGLVTNGFFIFDDTTDVAVFKIKNNSLVDTLVLDAGKIGVNVLSPTSTLSLLELAGSSGQPTVMMITGGAHTGLTASAETVGVDFDLNATKQFATGAITTQREMIVRAPTYAFVGASTITTAATFTVDAAPIAGTNATITRSIAVWVPSGDIQLDIGALVLPQISAPSAVASHGQIYTKTDDLPYYTNGAGSENQIALAGACFGEMFINGNSTAVVIDTADIPVAVRLFSANLIDEWTFDAGSTGPVTSVADDGGGEARVTDTAHGLVTGDFVTVRGTTDYNAPWQVTRIDDDTFDLDGSTFTSDQAGNWDQGSSLIAGTGAAGTYAITWHISGTSASANHTFEWSVYKGLGQLTTMIMQRKFSNVDVGGAGQKGLLVIAAGDVIWFTVENVGNTGNFTHIFSNVHVNKI